MNRLSDGAERLFWRLTTVADDFGRFEADARVLLAQCFPLKVGLLNIKAVGRMFQELIACGLVTTYDSGGKRLGFFVTWDKHQRVRAQHSKYPAPTSDNIRGHVTADVPVVVVEVTESRSNRESISCSADDAEPATEILTWLNQKTGKSFRPVEANLGLIRARLADGVEAYQLKAIVSRKAREWAGTEQAKYLRPATLFNRTKCEQYLGELPPAGENGHHAD